MDIDGAFPDLVRSHQDAVYSIALRWSGGRADAEDVAQEVFVRAYRALHRYDAARRESLRVRPWLATITLNVCRNRARSASRRPVTVPLDAAPELAESGHLHPSGADGAAAWDDLADVASALARLPDVQRRAIVLHHAGGLTYGEVASTLGRPEGTVKADVHRGLHALRTLLPPRELPA